MPIAKLNSALEYVRGQIDGWVYKRYGDKIVITRVPKFSGQWSAKQKAARKTFGLASRYAEKICADPKLKTQYAKAGKRRGLGPRAMAIREFMQKAKAEARGAAGRAE